MPKRFLIISALFLSWLLLVSSILAGPKDPVEGLQLESFVGGQHAEFQSVLRIVFPEEQGFIVTGPLDPNVEGKDDIEALYSSLRIICPSISELNNNATELKKQPELEIKKTRSFIEKAGRKRLSGYRGIMLELNWADQEYNVQLQTINQLRWLIWARSNLFKEANDGYKDRMRKYSASVSDYLYQIDNGNLEAPEPKAADLDLPEEMDIYAPAPDYVIQGYKNYKEYLYSHGEVVTDFTSGVLAFVPTAETIESMKDNLPPKAYPNKEAPLLQEEFRKFLRRGGKMSSMRTLTKEAFDTLQAGEYFFAVGLSGTIRFGRELLREEVKRIEEETGQKPARANHAFLFAGEPIFTAGAFFIDEAEAERLNRVNTQSGHYFYSNITSTIREDIAERSNSYFLTIGHFFKALDPLGIEYQNVMLSKL